MQTTRAEEQGSQYEEGVTVDQPMLSLWDFKEQHQLPLNAECMNVLHTKTAHLKDRDFVLVVRPFLELIGFKNKFNTTRNKMDDNRLDFTSAMRMRALEHFVIMANTLRATRYVSTFWTSIG